MSRRILYIDCFSGIAGDMMLGALIDLGVPVDHIRDALKTLDISGWTLKADRCTRQGLSGVDVQVGVEGDNAKAHGRTWRTIRALIADSGLNQSVKTRALHIFERLAEAEARIHDMEAHAVHFHEVGALDAIVDICGVAIGLEWLGVDDIICAPIPTPRGWVDTAHGKLPLPAPATMELLKGASVVSVDDTGEWVTPTGAAISAALVKHYGPMPTMTVDAIGYGAGDADPETRPNLLRLVLGSTVQKTSSQEIQIEANIDDMSPELIGYLTQRLLEQGANDVWLTPIQMKKGRPATQLSVLTDEQARSDVIDLILRESTTIGVRILPIQRHRTERHIETVDSPWGPVRVKVARDGDQIVNRAPEYDDCQRIAREHQLPLKEVFRTILSKIGSTSD
jgi:hypothetical protein